ncbi:MAG: hypothetical protein ACLRZ7_12980, partial [Lachnospiraceae bacterium]
ALQTPPQALRFKEGHTYRVSFLYQTNIDNDFAFAIGEGNTNKIKTKENLPHTPLGSGNKTYVTEFTSESDQTWISIYRDKVTETVSENPNPFVIDNLLVEDITKAEDLYKINVEASDGVIITPNTTTAMAGEKVTFTVSLENETKEIDSIKVIAGEVEVDVTKEEDGSYSFIMPQSDVIISVFTKDNVVVDKENLKNLIDKANGIDKDIFTSESVAVLNDVLDKAIVVYEDVNATQEEVDTMCKELEAAIYALVPVTTSTEQTEEDTSQADSSTSDATSTEQTEEDTSQADSSTSDATSTEETEEDSSLVESNTSDASSSDTTTDPVESGTDQGESNVPTGDNVSLYLWIAIVCMSGISILGLIKKRKASRSN